MMTLKRRQRIGIVLAAAVAALVASPALAVVPDVFFNVASGDFTAGASWDTLAVPGIGDSPTVDNGGTATIKVGDVIAVGRHHDDREVAGR